MVDLTPLFRTVHWIYSWFFGLSFSVAGTTFTTKDLLIFTLMSTILLFIIKNVFGLAGSISNGE